MRSPAPLSRLRRLRSLLALGPLAVLLLAPSPAAAAPSWLAPQPLAGPEQNIRWPQVATDPQGNSVAVWQRLEGLSYRIEAAFRPAGGSFGPPQQISSAAFSSSLPQIVTDAQGNSIAIWQSSTGGASRIQAAFRPAGGLFGEPQFLSAPEEGATAPQIAADPQGNAVAVWQLNDESDQGIEAAFRPAGGLFGTPQQLTAEGINAYEPQVSVDPQGNAIAVWRVFDGTNYRIETAFRPVGGQFQAWKLLSEAGKNAKEPQVAFDPQGNATAVWTFQDGAFRIESAFRPAGGTFGPGHPISPPPHSSSDSQVTTDPQGNAIAVWRGYDGSNNRIETAFRAAGSGFFGLPQRISAAGKDATAPQLATHPVGNAIAVWESEDGANLSVEAALRPAGGSFGAPQQISAAGQSEFNPQIATDSEGNAIAVWQRFDGSSWRTEAAGFDAAGPQMRSLSIPASAERGRPAAFSVAPFDVWSPVAATSWSFGDGGSAQGSAVSHAFAKPGNYPVTVASTDVVGNSSSAAGTVMVKDTIKPAISRLQVRPNAVRVAAPRKRARGSAALRPKRGGKKKSGRKRKVAKIRFRLSEPARVTFTAKRRVRRRCGKRRCVKLVAVKGKRTVAGKQGANAVRFDGRLGRRKLAPGRYVLSARAIDPYGNRSRRPATRPFRVIR